jgi:hypothetical protein
MYMGTNSDPLTPRGQELMDRVEKGGSLSNEDVVELLLELGEGFGKGTVSHVAMDRVDLREPLVAALKHDDLSIRRKAAHALLFSMWNAESFEERFEDDLLAGIKDPDPIVRGLVLGLLEKLESDKSLGALIDALQDESAYVRSAAANNLGRRKDKRAIDALQVAADDPDSQVMAAATGALAETVPGHPTVTQNTEKLIALYRMDKNGNGLVARTLGHIGTSEAVAVLLETCGIGGQNGAHICSGGTDAVRVHRGCESDSPLLE